MIPRRTAEYSLGPPLGGYPVAAAALRGTGAALVRPMASIACLSACVGPDTASHCGALCGGDINCWSTCAGPAAVPCVQACLKQ
jgi:hypothetical protein